VIVDAHHHVWRLARGDYEWLTPDLPIHRDYGLEDLRPLLGDIDTTVLVQAAPTGAETEFLLQTAAASQGLVGGVVGWTDLAAPDAPERIAALAVKAPLLKGLRPMLQDVAQTEWILRREIAPAMHAMVDAGLRFDALIRPRHLPVVLRLCTSHPHLAVVIDHGAKPDIAADAFEPWASDIAAVARQTNARCKLSGLVTEAASDWQVDHLRRYVDHLLGTFGPARLMWGSDWPVVNLAAGYARWRAASIELLHKLADNERHAVLGGTAAAFYGLG